MSNYLSVYLADLIKNQITYIKQPISFNHIISYQSRVKHVVQYQLSSSPFFFVREKGKMPKTVSKVSRVDF